MGLNIKDSVPVITVLLQGFLSFFSPCVLPLLPLYIGYLSGGTGDKTPEGEITYNRKKVLINTICFVIGIGFSFFLLGLGMRTIGRFFSGNQILFARLGGMLIIIFGLYQLGVFGPSSLLMKERRLPIKLDKMAMSPLTALIMGFVFSFAWTPCVGPTLSSVLLMAASAKDSGMGFFLVGVYTIGFALPFLLAGIFTTSILSFFKKNKGVIRYTVKISGALLILMGILMMTGKMNTITGYLSRISASNDTAYVREEATDKNTNVRQEEAEEATDKNTDVRQDEGAEEVTDKNTDVRQDEEAEKVEEAEETVEETDPQEDPVADEKDESNENELLPAPDFTLTDQYGVTHTLSDYKGKIVFLNFWASWCPPCRAEMPDIQAIYEETIQQDDTDLVILGVAFPNHGDETDEEGIKAFLEKNGYTYPTVMDKDASLMLPYYITAYPTTYMIDKDGNVYGYVPGAMTRDIMEDIIRQTRND